MGALLGLVACGGQDAAGSGGSASGGAGAGGDTGSGGSASLPTPDPARLPTATGACPTFSPGTVTFAPAGIAPRDVEIWMAPDAADRDGPLVFYWHGAGSSPVTEPPYGLGTALDAVVEQGGVVAAPHHDPAAGQLPWFLATGYGADDDLLLADEVLACAIESVGVDLRRIHSVGMSAGGLQTTQMSYRRSGYLASVTTYSGGLISQPPEMADPLNLFPAMIFHGGPSDQVVVSFQTVSEAYRDDLRARGHFAFICDHGNGHKIPLDARGSSWQFLSDHPFGTAPSPYEGGLPEGFPTYCAL